MNINYSYNDQQRTEQNKTKQYKTK